MTPCSLRRSSGCCVAWSNWQSTPTRISARPYFAEHRGTIGRVSISPDAGALTDELVENIKPSVGMRNTIVHEYIRVDYAIVAEALPLALKIYGEYRRQIADFVTARIGSA